MKRIVLFIVFSLTMAGALFVPASYAQSFSGTSSGDIFILPPYRSCLGADDGGQACFIQAGRGIAKLISGQLDFALRSFTVATLPSAVANPGRLYRVTDGTSSSDCTAGGGTTSAVCASDGSVWAPLGGAGAITCEQMPALTGAVTTSGCDATIPAQALANGMTATTQTVGDNSTKLATTAFVLANGSSVPAGTEGDPYCTNHASTIAGCGQTVDTSANTVPNAYNYNALLIPNGDFEDGSATLPGFWGYSGTVSPTLAYNTSTPYQGLRSIRITASAAFQGIESTQVYSCKPGDTYYVSWASRYVSGGTTAGYPYLFAVFNHENVGSPVVQVLINADTNWHLQTFSFSCPTGAQDFEIGTHSNFAGATVWEMDSIQIQYAGSTPNSGMLYSLNQIPDTPQGANNATTGYVRQTMQTSVPFIQNGGFENSTILPPQGWFDPNISTTAAGPVFSYDTSSPPEGARALSIDGTGVVTPEIQVMQAFKVKPGDLFTLTGWTKYISGTIAGGQGPHIYAQADTGTLGINQAINSSDSNWHAFSYTYTIGAGVSYVNVFTQASGTSDEKWEIDGFALQGPMPVSNITASYITAPIIQSTVGTQTVSGADYTNTSVTPSTVFSWTLPSTATALNYRYSCDIMWESTAVTLVGPVFGVNLSAAPTQLTAVAAVQNTLAGADINGYLSNTTTGSQTLVTSSAAGVTSTNYWARIWGTIEGAATAGSTFIINAASTSGTTASLNIRRGSSCTLN